MGAGHFCCGGVEWRVSGVILRIAGIRSHCQCGAVQ